MVSCTNSCGSSPQSNIRLLTLTKPNTAIYGDTFSVSVIVANTNILVGAVYSVDLEDVSSAACLQSSTFNQLYAGKQEVIIFNNIRMPPSGNLKLKLSLSIMDMLATYVCEDYREFTVIGIDPTAKRYDCNPTTSKCEYTPDGSGTYLTSNCDNACPGGSAGSTCDPVTCPTDKNICLMGICLPKQVVLIGAVLIGLTMMSKKG